MNDVSKIIKKSGMSVGDFARNELKMEYQTFHAAVRSGSLRFRDAKLIMEKCDVGIERLFNAFLKSHGELKFKKNKKPKPFIKSKPIPKSNVFNY